MVCCVQYLSIQGCQCLGSVMVPKRDLPVTKDPDTAQPRWPPWQGRTSSCPPRRRGAGSICARCRARARPATPPPVCSSHPLEKYRKATELGTCDQNWNTLKNRLIFDCYKFFSVGRNYLFMQKLSTIRIMLFLKDFEGVPILVACSKLGNFTVFIISCFYG